jgi:hypothetical protein
MSVAKRPDDMGSVGLGGFLSDDLAAAFWTPELQIEESRWWPHVPFAFWLVAATRPRSLVELGTGSGVSYSAFCEAATRLELDARFSAIDSWRDDLETGSSGEEVYKSFKAFHDFRYSTFSSLVRASFDEARGAFADGSIDLLHIDGPQGFEAARDHFEIWRSALSSRAVVLLHGTRLSGDDFGVSKLYSELAGDAPHFEFHHGDGLGLIAAGPETPEAVAALCALSDGDRDVLRQRFAFLGGRWQERAIAFGLVQQFEDDFEALRPRYRRGWLATPKRFARSFRKTIDDPMRHFKKRKPAP